MRLSKTLLGLAILITVPANAAFPRARLDASPFTIVVGGCL